MLEKTKLIPVFIASDHGGWQLKNQVIAWLQSQGYQVNDLGAPVHNPDDDYPDYAFPLAEKVASLPESLGLLLCKSGGGMTIAANKVTGIRAVEVFSSLTARHAKTDNDANVLVFAALSTSFTEIKSYLEEFFANLTETIHPRHQRRLAKIANYESQKVRQ
jgi:ribose 5-phosphate isomerase B